MMSNKSVNLKNHLYSIQVNFQKKMVEFDLEMSMKHLKENFFEEEKGPRNWYMRTRYNFYR